MSAHKRIKWRRNNVKKFADKMLERGKVRTELSGREEKRERQELTAAILLFGFRLCHPCIQKTLAYDITSAGSF